MAIDLTEYQNILNKEDVTQDELSKLLKDLPRTVSIDDKLEIDKLRTRIENRISKMSSATSAPSEPEYKPGDSIIIGNNPSKISDNTSDISENDRLNILKEFYNGEFTSEKHADIFIEQLASGKIRIEDIREKKLQKRVFATLEQRGLSPEKLGEMLAKRAVENASVDYVAPISMASGTTITTDMMEASDLGLREALNKDAMDNLQKRDNDDYLIREAKKAALYRRLNGFNEVTDGLDVYREKLQKALDGYTVTQGDETKKVKGISKWHFIRRHRIRKAMRDIAPECHWGTKYVNGSYYLRPYYRIREKISSINSPDTRSKNFREFKRKLEERIEDKQNYAALSWKKNFWKKLKLKGKLIVSRSPETLTKKMLKNATISQLNTYIKDLNARSAPSKATEQGLKKAEVWNQLMPTLKEACAEQKKTLEGILQSSVSELGNNEIKSDNKKLNDFVNRLESRVSLVQKEYADLLKQNPTANLYKNLGISLGSAEELISREAVLEQILKTTDPAGYEQAKRKAAAEQERPNETVTTDSLMKMYLKEKGLSDEQIAQAIKTILPPKRTTPSETKSKDAQIEEEQQQTDTPEKIVEESLNPPQQQSDEEIEIGSSTSEKGKPEKVTSLAEILKGTLQQDVVYKHEKGSIFFSKTDGKNGEKPAIYLGFKDEKGESRIPEKEEVLKILEELSKARVKKMNLVSVKEGGLPLETQAALLAVMDEHNKAHPEAKIEISKVDNLSGVAKDENGYPKKKEKEEPTQEGTPHDTPEITVKITDEDIRNARHFSERKDLASDNPEEEAENLKKAWKALKLPEELRGDVFLLYHLNQIDQSQLGDKEARAVTEAKGRILSSLSARKASTLTEKAGYSKIVQRFNPNLRRSGHQNG